ncbi:hypothetical protein MHH81_05895 [Psychrobacillus sp. FSL H8-0484]|uniref:hypothetical protein n=1 Tax=Psychrobacillus sp. FSL H8-0484 TaxID=2921390 RepID=UPI0030FB9DB2
MQVKKKKGFELFKETLTDSFGATMIPLLNAQAIVSLEPVTAAAATILFTSLDNYKKKREQRNLQIAIEDLYHKFEEIEDRLPENQRKKLYPLFWDYVVEEQEEEKIQLFVNGFVASLTKTEIDMEKMYVYFDILRNLRVKEIHYFIDVHLNQNYKVTEGMFARTAFPEEDFDMGYHSYVNNKLERLGLIHLNVFDSNGTLDDHYEVTKLGNEINSYFGVC